MTLPGDRRNEDMAEAARIVAGKFDRYICRRDDNPRGRGHDEVPKIIRDALIENGVDPDRIEVIPEEDKAVTRALELGEAGDLILIFGDSITRTWKQIIYFNRSPEEIAAEAGKAAAPEAPPVPITAEPDDPLAKARPVADAPDLPEPVMVGSLRLVRDDRGVRIADEPETED